MNFHTTTSLVDEDGCEYDADVILIVGIDHYSRVDGSYSHDAASDADYRGHEEIDYTIEEVFIDNGKFDTKVPFTQELFTKDVDKIEEAIRDFVGE